MADPVIAIFCLALLFVLLFNKMPIAFALFLTGLVGMTLLVGFFRTIAMCATVPFQAISVYTLTAIPAFIAMGSLARRSGLTDNFFASATKWFSGLKGGLAMASVVAAAAFAAVTGSSVASVSALAPLTVPDMLRQGYDRKLASGAVASGNMLGILIPPSVTMVIYGEITGTSVGKCLMAGILPGLLSVVVFVAGIHFWVKIRPQAAPASISEPFRVRLASLPQTWKLWILMVVIFGGIYTGFFTPTEAGAVATIVCLCFCLAGSKAAAGSKRLAGVLQAFKEAALTSGMIFAVIIGAKFFDQFLVLSGLPTGLAKWIAQSDMSRMMILWIILLTYIPLGMLLDGASMILITVPIYASVLSVLGFDLIHVGVLVTAMVELGLITPPMGLNAYVVKGVIPELSLEKDIFAGCLPFIGLQILVITILVYFPSISLFLPSLM